MLLLTAVLSAATIATVPRASRVSSADCPRTTAHIAENRDSKVQLKKLNELPTGNVYKAVYRRIGGCEVPVVVRYDVGRR